MRNNIWAVEMRPKRKTDVIAEGLSLVLPVYNEQQEVVSCIENLHNILVQTEIPYEVIVVDDGSTDRTSQLLESIENIKVVRHKKNIGYGAAIKTGMQVSQYEWICITDADGTYPNEKIPEMVAKVRHYDMVVGARVGKQANIPLIRRPAKWVLSKIANYLAQQKIPDLNSGLRVFHKRIAWRFLNILPNTFSFTTTITLAMMSNNYHVLFVPIDYHPRSGISKIRPIHDTINFLQLIIRTILYFDPLRIFLPVGFGLILAASVLFILRLIQGDGYGVTIPMFVLAGIQVLAIGMLADLFDKRIKS